MTLDLSGAARFGPDLEWVDGVDYAVDARRAADFGDAIKEYWPHLDAAGSSPPTPAFVRSSPVPARARGISIFQALRTTALPAS